MNKRDSFKRRVYRAQPLPPEDSIANSDELNSFLRLKFAEISSPLIHATIAPEVRIQNIEDFFATPFRCFTVINSGILIIIVNYREEKKLGYICFYLYVL